MESAELVWSLLGPSPHQNLFRQPVEDISWHECAWSLPSPGGQVSTDNKDCDVSTWALSALPSWAVCWKSSKKNCSGASSTRFVACPLLLGLHWCRKRLLWEDNIKCLVRSVFSWEIYQKCSFIIWGFANVAIAFLSLVPFLKINTFFFLCHLKNCLKSWWIRSDMRKASTITLISYEWAKMRGKVNCLAQESAAQEKAWT